MGRGRAAKKRPRGRGRAESGAHKQHTLPMFRSRRAILVQRLWRLRCVAPGPDEGPGALKPAAHALFNKLKEPELELLLRAVEGRGGGAAGGCVWVEAPRGPKSAPPAPLLLCRLYRWPDLRGPHELKRLGLCGSPRASGARDGPLVQCCNPHHLSRIASPPETPLAPSGKVSPFGPQLKGPPNIWDNDYDNNNNNGRRRQETTLSLRDGSSWCKLAYWEHRLRVGRLFPVCQDSVCVFSGPAPGPGGPGLCLSRLPPSPSGRSRAVRRTRAAVGRGLLLSREPGGGGGVWAYNRGERPLFLHSPTLGPAVHKLPAGHAIKAFDYGGGAPGAAPEGPGPCDPLALRISFSKGWGPRYSRRCITSCPCWLEVLLEAPR